jgi:hypothetical protein
MAKAIIQDNQDRGGTFSLFTDRLSNPHELFEVDEELIREYNELQDKEIKMQEKLKSIYGQRFPLTVSQ